MKLEEKKIMPPPWLVYPEIERYSIGWRMGYGENYIYKFWNWLDTLTSDELAEYRSLFPEPITWKGWWDDEDSSEVLEHGDFWVNAWQRKDILNIPDNGSSKRLPQDKNGNYCCFGDISGQRMAVLQRVA